MLNQSTTMRRARASDASEDGDDAEGDGVWRIRDTVFFYADVSAATVAKLFKEIDATRRQQEEVRDTTPHVTIRIMSAGGEAYAGLAALDYLDALRERVHVTTVADGMTASAATFLLLGGVHRICSRHAHLLIHQIRMSGLGWTTFEEARDEVAGATKLMERVRALYDARCTIPEDKMRELMTREIVLDADDAMRFGIVDEVGATAVPPKTSARPTARRRRD